MKKYLVASVLCACFFMTSAQAVIINLTSSMNCAKANAGAGTCAAGGTGNGVGSMTYDTVTNLLNWNVSFSGLSGTVTLAHFHGPALQSENAGVEVTIGEPPANPAIGSQVLTPAQAADLLAGRWYINIHTSAFGAGEIRGQVEVVPTFSLYDNFSTGSIDPTRWGNNSFGRNVLESFKLVNGGALLVGNISYGNTGTDSGRPAGVTGVELTDTGGPGNLRGVGANVTMLASSSQNCATNPDTGRGRAQVRGIFFNDGASTGPGDATGDIAAGVQLVRNANNADTIEWFVFRCDDPACDASTDLDFGDFITTWTMGVPSFLFVFWDPANDRFVFLADGEVAASAYTQAEAGIPNADFPQHVMRVRNTPENCAVGPPIATNAFANFDDVFIGVAVPLP